MARPKGTGGQAKDLTPDEIKRVDRCLTGTRYELRDRAMFWLGLGSGMRISEICGLRVCSVQVQGRVLEEIILEKHSTKSSRSRTVFLNEQARGKIKAYLENRGQVEPDAPLFPSQRKPWESLSPRAAIGALSRAFFVAGIQGASSHSLRRTHANALRRGGVDLHIIQLQLGHASLAITERYFRVDPVEARNAIERLKL